MWKVALAVSNLFHQTVAVSTGRLNAARAAEERFAELGMTQAELAEKTGLDRTTVGAILRGEQWPQPRTRSKIEVALWGVSGVMGRIAAGEEPPPPQRTAEELRRLLAEAEEELAFLNPRYESTRRVISARLEREIAEIKRQLHALESND